MPLRAIGQDMQYAARLIRRAPAFAASAVLTLALGIGANTGIFSIINGFLRPLPVPKADRIVVLAVQIPGDETGFRYRFSLPALNDYRRETAIFSGVAGFETRIAGLNVRGTTTQFVNHFVTGNFFSELGVPAYAGRLFTPGEGEAPGSENVIVLGYEFWQRRFGGDPAIVGAAVRLDGYPARIVGVTPPGFHGLYQGAEMEGYTTIAALHGPNVQRGRIYTDRTLRYLTAVARLQPGVSLSAAQSAVDVVARRLSREYPAERDLSARVIPETAARPVPLRFLSSLMPLIETSLMGLAALVLLIACLNVANLLLVRATARQREMAMRTALGSGRLRLVRLLLAETTLLAIAGTLAGLLFARWATAIFVGTLDVGISIPLNLEVRYDWRVFVYAALISLVTGVLLGIAPAFRASRAQVVGLLHDGGYGGSSGAGRQRVRRLLVIAQVAGSLVLLIVAGLCVRSLQHAEAIDLGFDPANILTVRISPHEIGYTRERAASFYEELERRMQKLPGVESATTASTVPLGYFFDSCSLEEEGRPVDPDAPEPGVSCDAVGEPYFDIMRIPIVRGRAFADADTADSARVIVVNETLARRHWPNQDPIGKRLVNRVEHQTWTVVGVARDSKYIAVFEPPLPHVFRPIRQDPSFMRMLYVRSSMPRDLLSSLVDREIHSLDPEMPIADLKLLSEAINGGLSLLLFRVGAVQAAAMGLLGLLLAVVGVYGVVSYGASQRTREMGIRVALGADPRNLCGLVLRQGAGLVVSGIVCGLGIAAAVTRVIARVFFVVGAADVPTFAAVTALLSAVALMACYLPARRAMRVDPMVALRHE
jgi:macrolide transport system ATP-binding/permease protein